MVGKTKLTKTGRLRLNPQLLAERTRKTTLNDLGRFLKTVEKKDVFQINERDAEYFLAIYDRQGKRDAAIHCLADTNPFYRNLVARGLLQNNPLANYADKPSTVNRDYVSQVQIDRLMDLSETEALGMWDLRGRLIVALAYDFALRAFEIESLNESDVLVDDYVRVRLDSNIQKGGSKPEQVLSNYFPETKVLMNRYLELRRRCFPTTDALLISEKGRRLQGTGIRNAVPEFMQSPQGQHLRGQHSRTASLSSQLRDIEHILPWP